jgi:cation/acetate symporter
VLIVESTLGARLAQTASQSKEPNMTALAFFVAFVAVTMGITVWASRRNRSAADFYAAGRRIKGWQNGIAVAGDYMSAASFLGIAGIIGTVGYDGFMYSVGWLVAYLTVLLIVAEPLRNLGKYTLADVLAYRLKQKPVRAAAALSTLTVSGFYMIAQMVGAGSLVNLLLKLEYWQAVTIVGVVMLVYVVFGGMTATTWVQIVKAILLILGTIALTFLVLAQFNFDLGRLFDEATMVRKTKLIADVAAGATVANINGTAVPKADSIFYIGDGTGETKGSNGEQVKVASAVAIKDDKGTVTGVAVTLAQPLKKSYAKSTMAGTPSDFMKPGGRYNSTNAVPAVAATATTEAVPAKGKGWGALDLISLGLALIFGTAGLPHILIRFFTVPDAVEARKSVIWAMVIIGSFYIMTTFLGYGAATLIGVANIGIVDSTGKFTTNSNMAAVVLADKIGGEVFFAFVASVAFATILAVVAGLTITASTAFAHDVWLNIVKSGEEDEKQQLIVARITAFVVGAISIGLAILMPGANAAALVALAFAVAASSNLPVIVLTLFWKRFNTAGAVGGLLGGLLSSVGLILISYNGPMGFDAPFQLENPGIVSIPIGFLSAIVCTLVTKGEATSEVKYAEMHFRSETGVGAEKAAAH